MMIVVARNQLLLYWRERIVRTMSWTMLTMAALAGILGWSSRITIVRVYADAVELLAASGKPAPSNPFALRPELALMSNMEIYIPMIGALLALLIGNSTFVDDQATGIGRLVFSRQLSRSSYVGGKMIGASATLAFVLAITSVVSWISLLVANATLPSADADRRLLLFYFISWLYLLVFAVVGMLASLVSKRRSLGLLIGIGVWLAVTFVLPQVTSGLRPTESLNPVANPVSTSQTFFSVTSNLRPISIAEGYKTTSAQILETAVPEPGWETTRRLVPTVLILIVLSATSMWVVQRYDFSRSTSNE